MRLDPVEKALEQALSDVDREIYLFGSHVDNNKRVGDIGLLVFLEENSFELSRKIAINFFMECEEKLDVIVMHPRRRNAAEEDFLRALKSETFIRNGAKQIHFN